MKSIKEMVEYYIGDNGDRADEVLEYYNNTVKNTFVVVVVSFFVFTGVVGLAFLIGSMYPSNGKTPNIEEFGSVLLAIGLFIVATGMGAYLVYTDVYSTARDLKRKITYFEERMKDNIDAFDDAGVYDDDFVGEFKLPVRENVGDKDYERRDSTEQDRYSIR